nr:non-homologous end-joining DNA ligase [Variovorax sp. dw_954]
MARYWAKRDFGITAEPRGEHRQGALTFVVQKHAASRLHYDFRLELDGVLVSWAVPKGPSFDPSDKRMAIHVADHPLSYGSFEGTIPPKQYGAGEVIVWDRGTWEPVGDPRDGLAVGKVLFKLHGEKLHGLWELVKIAKGGEKQEPWILFKKRDAFARPKAEYDVVMALPDSVITKPSTVRGKKKPVRFASAVPSLAERVGEGARARARARARAGAGAGAGEGEGISAQAAGAVKAALPEKLTPQLATLAAGVPRAGEWIYEIKFDGYRLMARIDNGHARLITRGGHDWSSKMPTLIGELEQLGMTSGFLDGEIVVLGPTGSPDFNALQNAFDRGRGADQIVFFLFDVPFFEGYDLRAVTQRERRALLKAFLDENATEHVRYSADFEGDPASILASPCRLKLEGLIAKRADAPYVSRRSDAWLKLKCKLRQEFVVAGYTERSDNAAQVGSLLLGVHAPDGKLVAARSVGTGWDVQTARELKDKLAPLQIKTSPFAAGPAKPGRWSRRVAHAERWVEPKLVAEVAFAE